MISPSAILCFEGRRRMWCWLAGLPCPGLRNANCLLSHLQSKPHRPLDTMAWMPWGVSVTPTRVPAFPDWMKLGRSCPLHLRPWPTKSASLCECSPRPVSKCCVLKSQSGLREALLNLHRPLVSALFPWALGYFYSLRASSHSSGAGRGGVHLALLLTQDKRAWGPRRFTLAARGFQNSKLFFITATWYEGRCSRCTQIPRRLLGRVVEGEDPLKFALVSRKKQGPLSQWPFPFGWVKVSLLKANLVLGQGGSTITQQPGHPHGVPSFCFLSLVER